MTALLTGREIEHAKRLARMHQERRQEGTGFVIAVLLGGAIWLAIGLVIYFTCF